MLRLVDTTDDRLLDTFAGYYASLNCVSLLLVKLPSRSGLT